jgi:hypothetical protein
MMVHTNYLNLLHAGSRLPDRVGTFVFVHRNLTIISFARYMQARSKFIMNSEEVQNFAYNDGDKIEQKWHVGFIFLAYVAAFLGSYAAIRILEHGLWRSERERQNATSKYR